MSSKLLLCLPFHPLIYNHNHKMGSSLADDVHFNPTALRGIGPVVDPGGRLHWTKSDIRALLALADANRIPIRGADRSVDATMVPCMFTGGISEAAHWLPFREVQNPSLWLWSRLVGLAPWTYEGSRQTKRALDNLIPFSTNLHQLMDKADEIFVTPVETTILALIQLLEEMLANEELRTDLGTRWLWDFAGELKRKMPGREVLGVKAVSAGEWNHFAQLRALIKSSLFSFRHP